MNDTKRNRGRWLPGISGNPGGRPRVVAEITELAREHSRAALSALVEIATDKEQPGAARVAAATALLDRGYGRPPSSLDISLAKAEPDAPDLSLYTLEELQAFTAIHEAAATRRALPSGTTSD